VYETKEITSHADREIVTTRVIDAPRELVFKAWIDPEQLARWWGPKGFSNTFHEFEPKPGGAWRFVMHGPDGRDYKNESVFLDVETPERIVFRHVSPPQFTARITFAEHAGKTKVTWRMIFETATERDNVARYAVGANEENMDRLEAQLDALA